MRKTSPPPCWSPSKFIPNVSGKRRSAFVTATAVLVLIAALELIPTPYYLLAPGSAVDLSQRIAVEGHVPTRRKFYLTDVTVMRATLLLLPAALAPGMRLVKHEFLLPPGQTMHSYDRVLTAAMDDSQHVAAYVAERAAGFPLPAPAVDVEILDFAPASHARKALRVGDRLVRVDSRTIAHRGDVSSAIRSIRAGMSAVVEVRRAGRTLRLTVPTIATPAGTRLGIEVGEHSTVPELPVPVHFTIPDVEGSSGGLMFALAIYAELKNDRRATIPVAGTGTISADGTVGPIEGTQQKIIAAKRAGARIFLVPRANYADVENEPGIRVIPVGTFADAVAAIRA